MEIAPGFPGVVPVRDSKAGSGGPVLLVRRSAWAAFTGALRGR
ncbi:DUF397 domain-containing protein [Streptomyces sp. MS06]